MLTHHLLDSLAVIGPLRRQLRGHQPADGLGLRLLDVGSGAGLPGVVIAICCPDVAVSCVDTVAKKVSFIQQAAISLKLPNLKGLHARVENLDDHYDVVCSRAFASLADFTAWSRSALAPAGVWLAMKAKHPTDELAALPAGVEVFHVEQLSVPGLDAQRCLVWLRASSRQVPQVKPSPQRNVPRETKPRPKPRSSCLTLHPLFPKNSPCLALPITVRLSSPSSSFC
jgi:16S rRNA (guanine527-N7)-methyltransferase